MNECPMAVASSLNWLMCCGVILSAAIPEPKTSIKSSICVEKARNPQRLRSSFKTKPLKKSFANYLVRTHATLMLLWKKRSYF